ncbi:phosphatase PAP2 family protein [Pseudomonas sp. NFXW11]|uniref:acid phosphatase n=1 Tax=Pseudomonas sp. NFXW11 TaxID=2819531 RepID=UPI003CF9E184
MIRKSSILLVAVLLTSSLALQAKESLQPYLAPQALELAVFLPPPPTVGSAEDREDLAAVLQVQRQRTPQEVERAKRDDHLSDAVFPFAGEIFGPRFTLDRHPHTAHFFRRTLKDLVQTLMPAKAHFARPRPYEASKEVQPILPPPMGESYPSGHTMDAYLTAILLARMVPEKRDPLFARAAAAAQSRVVAGVHYPTDLEGGRISAVALAAELLHNPAALDDFNRARREVRATLALD